MVLVSTPHQLQSDRLFQGESHTLTKHKKKIRQFHGQLTQVKLTRKTELTWEKFQRASLGFRSAALSIELLEGNGMLV